MSDDQTQDTLLGLDAIEDAIDGADETYPEQAEWESGEPEASEDARTLDWSAPVSTLARPAKGKAASTVRPAAAIAVALAMLIGTLAWTMRPSPATAVAGQQESSAPTAAAPQPAAEPQAQHVSLFDIPSWDDSAR